MDSRDVNTAEVVFNKIIETCGQVDILVNNAGVLTYHSISNEDKKTYDAVGCEHCSNIGYKDRVAIFEVLQINDEIKELISNDESPIKIKREALKYGYEPLEIDGIRKVIDGVTNMKELNKMELGVAG